MSAKMLWRKMFGIDSDAKSPRQVRVIGDRETRFEIVSVFSDVA